MIIIPPTLNHFSHPHTNDDLMTDDLRGCWMWWMNELRSDNMGKIPHGKHFRKIYEYIIAHLSPSLPDGGSLARRTAAEIVINAYVF